MQFLKLNDQFAIRLEDFDGGPSRGLVHIKRPLAHERGSVNWISSIDDNGNLRILTENSTCPICAIYVPEDIIKKIKFICSNLKG